MNKFRPSIVFVSTTNDKTPSTDHPDCLFQPAKVECSTLSFVLSTITSKEMFWIDTIFLNAFTSTENESMFFPEQYSAISRGINITCLKSCIFDNNWAIMADIFQRSCVVQLENITFQNSTITVGNVHVVFKNIQFVDSLVTDWVQSGGELDEVELHFVQTSFLSQSWKTTQFGLMMKMVLSASIFVASSKFNNTRTQLSVLNLLYDSRDTSYMDSHVLLEKHTLLFSMFQNVLFTGFSEGKTGTLYITGNKLLVEIVSCIFDNTIGLKIVKRDSGFLDSLVQIDIQSCIFQHNRKIGSGGAICVNYVSPTKEPTTHINFVKIANCTMTHNEAVSIGTLPSQGGALSVSSQSAGLSCTFLSVEIENSNFINNRATDHGGAVFVSEKCLQLSIYNSSFKVTDPHFDSPKGVFVFSFCDIAISLSAMSRELKHPSPSLVALQVLSQTAQIRELSVTVVCHAWHKLSFSTSFVHMQAKEVQITCVSCTESFYVPSDGQFSVNLLPNYSELSVQSTTMSFREVSCIPCPAGAYCPGNDMIASPNYWGHMLDDEIKMYECPPEYCCTGNCTGYNHCSGHRKGVLCGSCEESYSLSMLSSQCLAESDCSDYWLWLPVVVAMVLYMLWYVFKNDVFEIPTSVAGVISGHFCGLSQDSDLSYIEKGYFGIVSYFTQIKAVMVVAILIDSGRTNKSFSLAESYINLLLNIELTNINNDVCIWKGVTTTSKICFKFLFLVGTIIAWNILFVLLCILKQLFMGKRHQRLKKFTLKLITGLLEIIKYTYSGFSSVMFYSLVCTSVAGNKVWFYDGSVQCYNRWQVVMFIFGLTFIVPYPVLFYCGVKLLRKKQISGSSFLVACCFPLPALVLWCFVSSYKRNGETKDVRFGEVESVICDGLTGGFRDSEQNTQCWEAVLMFRRLLMSATILIPDVSIQLTICLFLSLLFLIHHLCRNPFVYNVSNKAETLSLTLLCGVAAINLFKTAFLFTDIDMQSTQGKLLKNLELLETLSVMILISFIICSEVRIAVAKRVKRQHKITKVSSNSQANTRT